MPLGRCTLSGRTRLAATVQLHAVRAVRAAGLSRPDAATGVWNLLSGALHALVVDDLLDTESCHRLVQPWREAPAPDRRRDRERFS